MKKLIMAVTIVILAGPLSADVTKKSKSVVTFKGFGSYTTEQDVKISENLKREDSKNKFDGKGLAGKIAGKLFLKSGDAGEIVNLAEMKIYELDHKKKKYRARTIEKFAPPEEQPESAEEPAGEAGETGDTEAQESEIEIIKSEFKVEDSGETRTINNFLCRKYTVLAYAQWRHKQTGETGTDSLFTTVWSTAVNEELQAGQQEEMRFHTAYMEAVGFDLATTREQILGSHWMKMFSQMQTDRRDAGVSPYEEAGDEMAKIEGYPVVVDGKYYAVRPQNKGSEQAEEPQEQESTDPTDMNKALGGLAKGIFGKKKADKAKEAEQPGLAPVLTYYTEVLDFRTADFDKSVFQVPGNYKQEK